MTPDHGRRPLIAGNWKLWGTRAQAVDYCERLKGLLPGEGERHAEIGVCPVFTALDVCADALGGTGVKVYSQNMHHEETGAFGAGAQADEAEQCGKRERKQNERGKEEGVSCRTGYGADPNGVGGDGRRCNSADRSRLIARGERRCRLLDRINRGDLRHRCGQRQVERRQREAGERQGDEREQAEMGDGRALGRRPRAGQSQQAERDCRHQQGLQREEKQGHGHFPLPRAWRARAIAASSSSSSLVSSSSAMPTRALAALTGDPLKKVRTI